MRQPIYAPIAALAILVLVSAGTSRVSAAKPTFAGETAEVTFRDNPDDGIQSDSAGPYVEGERGSVCRIYTGGSQDLTIGTFRSGRLLRFIYSPATDVGQPTTNLPSGSLSDNAFMNIRNIGAMQLGETKLTLASFNTAIGSFRWYTDGANGSQAVVVTRNTRTTWTVRAEPDMEGAGDLAVLMKEGPPKNTLRPIGFYHMPFQLDVMCANCPAPPPPS